MEHVDILKKDDVEFQQKTVRASILLQSLNKDKLKKVVEKLEKFLEQQNIMNEKKLSKKFGEVTTRRAPSGQGTATFSRYKLMIHQYDIVIECEHMMLTQAALVAKADSVKVSLNMILE